MDGARRWIPHVGVSVEIGVSGSYADMGNLDMLTLNVIFPFAASISGSREQPPTCNLRPGAGRYGLIPLLKSDGVAEFNRKVPSSGD